MAFKQYKVEKGGIIEPGKPSGSEGWTWVEFIYIGLVVLLLLFVIGVVTCCCVKMKKRRRNKERERSQLEKNSVLSRRGMIVKSSFAPSSYSGAKNYKLSLAESFTTMLDKEMDKSDQKKRDKYFKKLGGL